MFSFFKEKQTAPSTDKLGAGQPIISTLHLELAQAAKARIAEKAVANIDRGDGVFSFDVGDEFLALAHMPAPYPAVDLEGPIARTWMWPPESPVANVKRHRSHLLITMTGGKGDPVRRRLILTAVTALAAKQEGTLLVFPPLSAWRSWPVRQVVLKRRCGPAPGLASA